MTNMPESQVERPPPEQPAAEGGFARVKVAREVRELRQAPVGCAAQRGETENRRGGGGRGNGDGGSTVVASR